jgi:threonine/homoserine/homoserine lactone efflux protein
MVHILLAVTGVSFVVARFSIALTVIQVLGALYLCYLGVALIARRNADPIAGTGHRKAFRNALGTNLLNPKAIIFVTGVLPQFATGTASLPIELALLGVIDVGFGIAVYLAVVLFGTLLSGRLEHGHIRRRWNCANGVVLTGLGVGLGVANL